MKPGMRTLALLALLFAAACGGGDSPSGPGPSAPSPSPSAAPGPTIGAEGGTLTSSDGRAVLVVPPSALPSATPLTLRSQAGGVDPSLVGPTYVLGPDGTSFARPVELSLAYDPDLAPLGADESELRVQKFETTSWTTPSGRADTAARRVIANVDAAGTFAVRWPEPAASCGGHADAEFDFWLGDWDYVVGGRVVGTNQITRDAAGCVVHENYNSGSGRSVSFRGDDSAWYQTYVQAGSRLEMRGGLEGRRMLLYTTPASRFVWDPVSDDRVLYFAESTSDGGATWAPGPINEYVRR
jgi:hypothetical protein